MLLISLRRYVIVCVTKLPKCPKKLYLPTFFERYEIKENPEIRQAKNIITFFNCYEIKKLYFATFFEHEKKEPAAPLSFPQFRGARRARAVCAERYFGPFRFAAVLLLLLALTPSNSACSFPDMILNLPLPAIAVLSR